MHQTIRRPAVAAVTGNACERQPRDSSRRRHRLGLLLTPVLIAGCAPGTFLSESGPTRGAIVGGASQIVRNTAPEVRYRILEVNDGVLKRMAQPLTAPPDRGEHAVYRGEIGIGDIVGVTIFESDSGGLFLPREGAARSGNYVALPNQQVDGEGNISVPYVGQVKAAGLLPNELGTKIQSSLTARALEPQVVVTIVERRADPISVLGEVGKATSFSLDPAGVSLLGAISKAEGPKYPAYESVVTLQHDGQLWRARLSDVEKNPGLNRWLSPGDTLYVSREQRYFVAMGAIGQSTSLGPVDRRLPFQDANLSLIDALGRAGGLNDNLANPRAIFVYRLEPAAAGNTSATNAGTAPADAPAGVPTIYLVNLSDPAGFFYASRFPMHGEDVVYVANAPATDLQKFLNLMLGVTASGAYTRETINPYANP